MILFPAYDHIDQIQNLNNKYLISHLPESQKQNGFIRIKYNKEDLGQIVSDKEIVIATHIDQIVGYYLIGRKSDIAALAYQKEKALAFSYKNNIDFSKVGFGCQVCIEDAYRNNGLFGQLLEVLSHSVNKKYSHLLCSISDDNIVSLKRHIDNGWVLIDSIERTKYFIYNTQAPSKT